MSLLCTKGPVDCGTRRLVNKHGVGIAQVLEDGGKSEEEIAANCALIVQAFNVAAETGMTPAQLNAERRGWEHMATSYRGTANGYFQDNEVAKARIQLLEDTLRDVGANGLIYWAPQTERGAANKALMQKLIADVLNGRVTS